MDKMQCKLFHLFLTFSLKQGWTWSFTVSKMIKFRKPLNLSKTYSQQTRENTSSKQLLIWCMDKRKILGIILKHPNSYSNWWELLQQNAIQFLGDSVCQVASSCWNNSMMCWFIWTALKAILKQMMISTGITRLPVHQQETLRRQNKVSCQFETKNTKLKNVT